VSGARRLPQEPQMGDRADGGCMLVIGIIIAGISVEHIWSAAYGWLVIGASFAGLGLMCALGRR
jgi:hypothetical protein